MQSEPHSDRFHDLEAMFPGTPRSIVIKADSVREGIQPSPALFEAGAESVAFPFFYGETGEVHFIPAYFILPDGTTTICVPHEGSPWSIERGDDGWWITRDGERLSPIHFMKRPEYVLRRTGRGSIVGTLFLQRGASCLFISPLNNCEYFNKGEECRFCAFNFIWDRMRRVGVPVSPSPDEIREGILRAAEEYRITHVKLCGGSLFDSSREAEIYRRMAEMVRSTIRTEQTDMVCQAYEKDDCRKLFDAGIGSVCQDLEVWSERLWPLVVPGKHKAVGRTEWLRRLDAAVEVFGEGNVASNLVGGVETVPAEGFARMEDAIADTLAGCEWLIRRGIEPTVSVWHAAEGSPYARVRTVPTEYHLTVGWGLHQLFLKHGMYEKFGYRKLGENPARQRIICFKCCFDNVSQDYPRLVGRPGSSAAEETETSAAAGA